METKPFVSIVTSVYNGKDWIEPCFDSLFGQHFNDFELIIVNDGSTDNSLQIIEDYVENDHRIHVISQENQGLAQSLNAALSISNGIWIARMDIDDLSLPSRLARQVEFVQNNANVVCVGSGFNFIDSSNKVLATHRLCQNHKRLVQQLINKRTAFPHSSVLFRKDIALKLGGYRTCMYRAQDTDLWLRMSEHGQLAAISDPLVCIRQHPKQLSCSLDGNDQVLLGWLAVTSYLLRSLGSSDPLDAGTQVFSLFRHFINVELYNSGFYRVRSFKANLKLSLAVPSPKSALQFTCLLVRTIMVSPQIAVCALFEPLFINYLSKSIAIKWSRHFF